MDKEWIKEQIELWKTRHPILNDMSDELIIENLEFEEEVGPMTEIYYKGQTWKKE